MQSQDYVNNQQNNTVNTNNANEPQSNNEHDFQIQQNSINSDLQINSQQNIHHDSHQGHSPLDQFKIKKIVDLQLGGIDISITNSAIFMIISTIILIAFLLKATSKKLLIPSKSQVIAESAFNFVSNIISETIGEEGKKFFPLVFTIFLFVFACNAIGLTPYSFTATSQIPVNFTLALIAFFTITIYAIIRNGFSGFLHMFLPSGVPILIAPLIFILELISFLIRPITLSVRLFANMVAGHVLLKVIAGFIVSMGLIFGMVPLLFATAMIGFEFFVAGLQAYIFAILVATYLGETTKEH
jgi:F-type H+-transporting ATPase subunit a